MQLWVAQLAVRIIVGISHHMKRLKSKKFKPELFLGLENECGTVTNTTLRYEIFSEPKFGFKNMQDGFTYKRNRIYLKVSCLNV